MAPSKYTFLPFFILFSLLFFTVSDSPAADRLSGKLLITGSGTMAPLISEMARSFERLHPGVTITVQGYNSTRGLSDTRSGRNSLGMVSRVLQGTERDLKAFPVALDAICFIVSSSSPVKKLSRAQLTQLFTGKVSNWKQFGGGDQPLKVLLRDDRRSSTKIVAEYLQTPVAQLQGVLIPAQSTVTIKAVAKNSGAIGYVSFGEAYRYSSQQGKIRMIAPDGQVPTKAAILNGSYPLIRVLTLVSKGEPTPLAREFIKYCRSKAVADIVQAFDFVNLEL
ncbi:phosphate ABC transporter substrate-binding protein [Geotalea sp. SG265]|uniref:phosphate ABC transporter substrate-binding protein n=1 Tax=Geotalea sp. SG265 TaxID=2922867 RepID=UPI001FAF75DC|nr:phosphate ABC transporter substrate-binding protein [Geotalea sp. SG265]